MGYIRSHETGYGRMSYQLVAALERQGVTITHETPNEDDDTPAHANSLTIGQPSHVRGWWEGQRTHCFTMWEGTVLPPGFRDNMHEFNTVIVPSQQNLELFSKFHPNVHKVGLGVDQKDWHYRPRRPVGAEFVFLTAGQGPRKGVDITMDAFHRVFGDWTPCGDMPIPKLLVKTRAQTAKIKGDRVTQLTGTWDTEDEIELYASVHCFVGLARGEGWGLMPFQAMAQGTPTILSDAHGHAEFSHLASTRISCGMSKAGEFLFGDAGEWWEPSLDETCEAMWDMYLNYEGYLEPAHFSAAVIADEYSWDRQATRLVHAMGGPQALDEPDVEKITWHTPEVKLYHVRVISGCTYEINGVVHVFKPGEDYQETADLKRMMFEHGRLDPKCLEDPHETGLLPAQMDVLEQYKSQKERCYACGQRYNSDMSVDEDEDALT